MHHRLVLLKPATATALLTPLFLLWCRSSLITLANYHRSQQATSRAAVESDRVGGSCFRNRSEPARLVIMTGRSVSFLTGAPPS